MATKSNTPKTKCAAAFAERADVLNDLLWKKVMHSVPDQTRALITTGFMLEELVLLHKHKVFVDIPASQHYAELVLQQAEDALITSPDS